MVLVSEVGEFGFIARLKAIMERHDENVIVGIGDDAAVVRYNRPVVMTTDAMVHGIHFREDLIDAHDVGYKALVASISDVAVMGGRAMHALVTLAVPKEASVEPIVSLYEGMRQACDEFSVTVIGGDVVSTTGPLLVSVSVTGELLGEKPLLRSGAKPGDLVFVTGDVGASAAYLHFVEHKSALFLAREDEAVLKERHQRPLPQVQAGALLANFSGCTSTNDISDGLVSELHEIAEASDMGIIIEAIRIPTLPAVRHYARIAHVDALDFALYGGEDYQIVGTVAPDRAGHLLALCQSAGIRITLIGRVHDAGPCVELIRDGRRSELKKGGYDHFLRN